jgi:hypothetical protein
MENNYQFYGNSKTLSLEYNVKITSPDANTTYIGLAFPGTAQASAFWQCKKILTSGTTTTITWADGDLNFDNVATDLTALSYS